MLGVYRSCCFPYNFDVVRVFSCWVSLLDASDATMDWHLWVVVKSTMLAQWHKSILPHVCADAFDSVAYPIWRTL